MSNGASPGAISQRVCVSGPCDMRDTCIVTQLFYLSRLELIKASRLLHYGETVSARVKSLQLHVAVEKIANAFPPSASRRRETTVWRAEASALTLLKGEAQRRVLAEFEAPRVQAPCWIHRGTNHEKQNVSA